MPEYCVTGTVSMLGSVWVTADSEEEALDAARDIIDAKDFDCDLFTAEVEFNVTPAVEAA